jgi:hypothetical protein
VFVVSEELGQFDLLLEPLAGIDIEYLRQPTPADVPHENRLFVVGRRSLLCLKLSEQPNCGDVGAKLLLE